MDAFPAFVGVAGETEVAVPCWETVLKTRRVSSYLQPELTQGAAGLCARTIFPNSACAPLLNSPGASLQLFMESH